MHEGGERAVAGGCRLLRTVLGSGWNDQQPACCCSAPAVTTDALSAVEGRAVLTPPNTSRPWARYELTVCVRGALPASCRVLTPLCAAAADPNANTRCAILGCDAGVTYDVRAVAIRASGVRSPVSNTDSFLAPAHG